MGYNSLVPSSEPPIGDISIGSSADMTGANIVRAAHIQKLCLFAGIEKRLNNNKKI
jgi:hypothetical protein